MNNNIFESFSEIKLSDSQKKELYNNIIKNETIPRIKKRNKPISYIMYFSTVTLIIVFCFCVKTFFDSNNSTSIIYTDIENEDKQNTVCTKKELEAKREKSEAIINKPQNNNQDLLLAPSKKIDKSQDKIDENININNYAVEENINQDEFSADTFSDFEALEEYLEEKNGENENKMISSGGGSSSDLKINFSELDGLLNDEKFGEYFPLSLIKDYSFSSGYIKGDYAVAYFNSNFYSITVTVNLLTENSAYAKISVEREDDNGRYFDVPTEKALITYFVNDKECKKEDVYSMIYSAKYFAR